ncbi:MAG: hypothetical protein ABWZ41_02595 [Burkholderiales bacterium]
MTKILPKGHVSCLSNAFRYTPALKTNVADTFARIHRELKLREALSISSTTERLAAARRFPVETIESARRLLRAGGLGPAPHLVHSS